MRKTLALGLVCSLLPWGAWAAGGEEAEVRKVAETYLRALTGEGDDSGKQLLLGGATMDAQLFNLENWKVVSGEPVQRENGDLASVTKLMAELDKAGRESLTKLMDSESVGGDLTVHEMSQSQATKLLAPTKARSVKLVKSHPVLAYVARVGKEVYWHPKNPIRTVLASAGKSGQYSLALYRFRVVSKEGAAQTAREWPLRVLRFKGGKVDTGWKVLPASNWSVD